jgi:hypothetical protein
MSTFLTFQFQFFFSRGVKEKKSKKMINLVNLGIGGRGGDVINDFHKF